MTLEKVQALAARDEMRVALHGCEELVMDKKSRRWTT